jgi:acid phosphatase (class A)
MSILQAKAATVAVLLCVFAAPVAAQTLMAPTEPAPAAAKAAVPKPVAVKQAVKLNYLPADFLAHPDALVPKPPKADSPEGERDLTAMKALQAAAAPERIARAVADDKTETVWAFADVLPGFTEAKLPLTAKLFEAARLDQEEEADHFKTFFARQRPFDIDRTVKVCVPTTYGAKPRSYPSGHATLGYSLGIVLANLIPEKAEAILTRAKAYGESRVICGVHFPADLSASQGLGTAIALEFMRSPAFKKDFAAAKAELTAAGLTN